MNIATENSSNNAKFSFNLKPKVEKCLKESPDKRFSAGEIADWIFQNHPKDCAEKKRRAPKIDTDKSLLMQIAGEISANTPNIKKKYPKIKTTEGRPRKYYYTELDDSAEIDHVETHSATETTSDRNIQESDLYDILAKFLNSEEIGVYSQRINESKSGNKHGRGGNRWLHPDLVGMEVLSKDWKREIKECHGVYADKKTKLWSFEVKIRINRGNVRETFFQAVSNSSWANFGYLVASEIIGTDTLKELRMLASLHGIGFIRLDVENPTESEIMILAKERVEIDWDIANRLVEENEDFKEYIEKVRKFYQTDDAGKDWLK